MTFIDRTIVAIAIPNIQKELSLTATCSKWVIDGYQLSLSALFAFGGRLADVLGRRSVVPGRGRIVVAAFPLHERGRAMAIFFGISAA